MPKLKPGRPISSEWSETAAAADEMGITPRQLRRLRKQLKAGTHYRVKNPRAARPEYLWHVKRIEPLLTPLEEVGDRSEASTPHMPVDESQP